MYDATREFLLKFPKALVAGDAVVFAGAGLSQAAGYVNWRELLRTIAEDIGLDVDREHDLVAVAQYHVNERGGRGVLNQHLIDLFTADTVMTENHRILARFSIRTFWTTNYDRLIEGALDSAQRWPDVKATQTNLATTRPNSDATVFKMHGDVGSPAEAVLTKDDYETYNEKRQLFSTKLRGDLVSKTSLFLGFSFDDPNLEYILSRVRILLGQNQRPHYCILRRPRRSDFEQPDRDAATVDRLFAYAEVKQEHRIKDLRRFAIHAVLIDEYSEVTTLLQRVEARFRRHSVLISGSAASYAPRTLDEGGWLVQELSRRLAEQFKIVSGFGVGVGSAVINCVLEFLEAKAAHRLDDHLALRPFPQWASDPSTLPARWTEYRQNLAGLAGIAVFVFGNKGDASSPIPATGVREKFTVATACGLKVLPVGATGFVAEELWKEVMDRFDHYYPEMPHLKDQFVAIATVLKVKRKWRS